MIMDHDYTARVQVEEALETHTEPRLLGHIHVGSGFAAPLQVPTSCDSQAQEIGPVEQLV